MQRAEAGDAAEEVVDHQRAGAASQRRRHGTDPL
jgi:hypothetical protein